MRYLFTVLLTAVLFCACKKDGGADDAPPPTPDLTPTISHAVDMIYFWPVNGAVLDIMVTGGGSSRLVEPYNSFWFRFASRSVKMRLNTSEKITRIEHETLVGKGYADYTYENDHLVSVKDVWNTSSTAQEVVTSYYYKDQLVDSVSRIVNAGGPSYFYVYNMKFLYNSGKDLVRMKYYTLPDNRLFRIKEFRYGPEVNPLRKLKRNLLDIHCFIEDDHVFSNSFAPLPAFYNAAFRLSKSSQLEYGVDGPFVQLEHNYEYKLDSINRPVSIYRDGSDYLNYRYSRF